MFGMSFEDLPPEMQEALKQMFAQHHQESELHNMKVESSRHRMRDFLAGLDEEQLLCLRGLIYMVMTDSDDETAGFYLGLTASMLETKFDYCLMCQVKHQTVEDLTKHGGLTDEPGHIQKLTGPGSASDPSKKIDPHQSMLKYNLKANPIGGYMCGNCGQPYQSVEDRMLRAPGPEGCEGCIQKEKWG